MKNIVLFASFFLILSGVYAQEFSKKEVKALEKVLKRSNYSIRDFQKNSLISIERDGNNEIEGMIENALFMAGFNVVSNKTAQDAVSISNPLNPENETIEITSSQRHNAVYVVTVSGRFFEGPLIGKCQQALISFSARIVDLLNGGQLVGTFTFTGNSLTYVACESDLANAFAYSLMKEMD